MKTLILLLAFPGIAMADPAFTDRAGALPVPQVYDGGWEHYVGGGVAILDCNGDALPDLFTAGGANPARLYVNTSTPGGDITFAAGTIPDLIDVTGAYPLDIDSDGLLDLAVLRVGANVLLQGGPDCSFGDATAAWGFRPGSAWSTAFAATWEPGQDWPTLAVGNYVDLTRKDGPFEACDANELHRPSGPGPGPGYGAPIRLEPGFCALSMLISDWKRNGQPDLRVSNDRQYYVRAGSEQMWNLRDLTLYGEDQGWKKFSIWGMGIASRDLTGDGLPELVLTSMGDQLMQINQGDGTYAAAPYAIGTYASIPFIGDDGRPSTGWHAEFGDIDNDGRADLFIAKGNVEEMPSNAMKDPNNLLMQQPDGRFVEKADVAGVASMARSRGAGLADLNADGRLDIVVINRRAPMEIWQNATKATGHWLALEPRQDGANTRAIGGWIELRTAAGVQTVELTVGGGHVSGQAGPVHFGLGDAAQAEVRIIWPDGTGSDWVSIAANQRATLRRNGTGLAVASD